MHGLLHSATPFWKGRRHYCGKKRNKCQTITFERSRAKQFKGKQKTNEINHCHMWVLQNLDVLHVSRAFNLLILNFCGRSKQVLPSHWEKWDGKKCRWKIKALVHIEKGFTLPSVCSLGTMLSFMLGVGHGQSQVKASKLTKCKKTRKPFNYWFLGLMKSSAIYKAIIYPYFVCFHNGLIQDFFSWVCRLGLGELSKILVFFFLFFEFTLCIYIYKYIYICNFYVTTLKRFA
jgi:hypothetical protein